MIVLLISADFINSDYSYGKQMKRALERHEQGQVRVIPIIVRNVNWQSAPFASLTVLPKNQKPISSWDRYDEAWQEVSEEIQRVVEQMQKGK